MAKRHMFLTELFKEDFEGFKKVMDATITIGEFNGSVEEDFRKNLDFNRDVDGFVKNGFIKLLEDDNIIEIMYFQGNEIYGFIIEDNFGIPVLSPINVGYMGRK